MVENKDAKLSKEYHAKYYLKNKNKHNAWSKEYYLKHKERILVGNKEYYLNNKEEVAARHKVYDSAHKEKLVLYRKEYWKNNRSKRCYHTQLYNARQLRATPAWACLPLVEAVYKRAQELGLTVDHVIPLRGKLVCGLHVPFNLQLLTRGENSRKGNRYA